MPFPVYSVTPVRLSSLTVPQEEENKLECVTNNTLCQVRLTFSPQAMG